MGLCELIPKLPSHGSLQGIQERLVEVDMIRATLTVAGTQRR